MNLAELYERFDEFVAEVAKRIEQGGDGYPPRDASAVLEPNKSQFKLRAITLHQNPPLFFAVSVRETLQKPVPIDRLAEEFVRKWREQVKADNSL